MKLDWEHDRDQALLALVVEEGYQAAQKEGRSLGRIALQKIMYFLKVTDVPMNYRFEIYRYGPFCSQIMRDADLLEFDDVIVDAKDQYGSSYQPSKNIHEFLGEFEEDIGEFRDSVRDLAEILAPKAPRVLELYATVHFVYREQKAKHREGPWKQTVLERFMNLKKERFNREEVESIYDSMSEVGIFQP